MDELGKSFPAAEGMVDAEEGGKPRPHNEFCLNCGTKLVDTFCQHCGQKDIPRRQTLGELFSNFISSFWSYEGKFFLTTKYLITKPGFLSIEYNAGRRESYYHPARMYVFISFVFFLLLFSLPDSDSDKGNDFVSMTKDDMEEIREDLKEDGLDSIAMDSVMRSLISKKAEEDSLKGKDKGKNTTNRNTNFNFAGPSYKTVKAYDSAQLLLPLEKRDGWFEQKLKRRVAELNERYKDSKENFGKDFGQAFLDNFSKVLFYLLPIFALLLKLFYIRRDFFYSEHLVFSIYYYNFFYLAASLQLLFGLTPALEWAGTLVGFWIFFYLLFGMKRMYNQSWGKTILKFSLFSVVFMFFLGIALGISAIAVLLMI